MHKSTTVVYASPTPPSEKETALKDHSVLHELDFYVKNELRMSAHLQKTFPHHYARRFFLPSSFRRVGDAKESVILTFPPNPTYVHTHLTQMHGAREFIYELLEIYQYALQSCVALATQAKIAHNRIQMDTLVMHPSGVVLFADFSNAIHLSTSTNTATTTTLRFLLSTFEPENIYRPMEHHILSYMQSNKLAALSAYHIQWIIGQVYPDDHPVLKRVGRAYLADVRASAHAHYIHWANRAIGDLIAEEIIPIEPSRPTWDVHGISMIFLGILLDIHRGTGENRFIPGFISLLLPAVHPLPIRRPCATQALRQWHGFLSSMKPIEYYKCIQAYDEAPPADAAS